MVFNAQAGPFIEGGNISPVGLCSVPLKAILSTLCHSSAPSASLHILTNTHSQALPHTPAYAFSHFVYILGFFCCCCFPLNQSLPGDWTKDYRLLSLAARSEGSALQQSPRIKEAVVWHSVNSRNGSISILCRKKSARAHNVSWNVFLASNHVDNQSKV